MRTAEEIVALLRAGRYRVSREAYLQVDLAAWLEACSVGFEREARLAPGERIDFLCEGGVGIEAKTRCDKRAIYRQLERYAGIDAIAALILITGTAMGLPPAIAGKPVFYVSIGRGAL